jgi:hypothetical protein
MLPFTILATLMLVLGLNLAEPALTLTAGVGVAFSLRIPGSWYADFQMKLLEDRGLRKLLILRRGKDLPAALLLQEYAFHLLVQEDERTTETIRALRDEWSGTTGSLIEAARVLVKENERP